MTKKILILVSFILVSFIGFTQNNCPFGGRVNCKGYCGRFIDTNGDGFCDYGIVKKEKTTENNSVTKAVLNKEEKKSLNSEKKTKKNIEKTKSLENKTKKKINDTLSTVNEKVMVEESIKENTETSTVITPINNNIKVKKSYNFLLISIFTLLLYAFTAILVKTKAIKKITHRKIWNFLLLITFLVSCLLGFFLALIKDYDINIKYYLPILKIHVYFGISMTIIAIIHIIWHIKYFKNLLKRVK